MTCNEKFKAKYGSFEHTFKFLLKSVSKLILLLFCCLFISCSSTDKSEQEKDTPPHILFISIDDLRPELGAYGKINAVTPNLDALAKSGIKFNYAFAQQAICGPSRASVMTGVRPDTLGVTHNYVKFRHKMKDVITIPQHFSNNGYTATYVGKIFHHGDKDEEQSWNRQPSHHLILGGYKQPSRYALDENTQIQANNRKEMFAKYGSQAKFGLGSGPAFEGADVADNAYIDGYNTDLAVATLNELLVESDKPIFFGLGMNKPHLPWISPKKYWDMYDPAEIKLAEQQSAPTDGAEMGIHASFELRTFYNIPKDTAIQPELAVRLKHAYLASVSYVDAQVGRVIDLLKTKGALDNTIIIVWSDHGYHLGEMGIWGKASNYEIATRVPLIISTPESRANNKPLASNALVELIDIYPTLAELAGLAIPEHIQGQSLVPLLDDPNSEFKQVAFSQFPTPALREWGAYPLRQGMRETYFGTLIERVENRIMAQQGDVWDRELFEHHLMGYSLRTKQYRMIAWKDNRDVQKPPIYVELYDHYADPQETTNIAKVNPDRVSKLLELLDKQPWLKDAANSQ